MTPRERSETSLEALTAEIKAWKTAHPGISRRTDAERSPQLSPEQQRDIWAGIARRIRAALNEEVKK